MDIQSTLTLAIEIIFWAMIVLMLNNFVNGFFKNFTQPQYTVSAQLPSPIAEINDIPNPVEETALHVEKFEQLPDPWELQPDRESKIAETQSVVIPFPTLRLLPPAQKVQPQTKRRGRPKKSGDSIQPTDKTESRKRGRPRKSA